MIPADVRIFVLAEFDGAQRREILRIVGSLDELFGSHSLRDRDFALFPSLGNVVLPGFAHSLYETVRTAEQKDMRTQCVPACEHRKVLQDDGVEERGHELIGRDRLLLQAIDISLGKDSALSSYWMQFDSVIALLTQFVGGNLELGVDLVDHRAGAAGALVVHRRNLFLAPTGFVFFKDNDLGVLPAEFDYGIHFGMKFLDRKRDCCDFLYKLRADQRSNVAAPGAGDEHAAVVGRDAGFGLHAMEEL